MRRAGAPVALVGLAMAGAVQAAPGAPPGANSCSGCHGVRGEGPVPVIHGRPSQEIVAALQAFRTGGRPAIVMNRIATGFTRDESEAIAVWLSRQPAP